MALKSMTFKVTVYVSFFNVIYLNKQRVSDLMTEFATMYKEFSRVRSDVISINLYLLQQTQVFQQDYVEMSSIY